MGSGHSINTLKKPTFSASKIGFFYFYSYRDLDYIHPNKKVNPVKALLAELLWITSEINFYSLPPMSLLNLSTYRAAASFPPRPKAKPPAMASIATNPVKSVWAKTPAIPN